MFFFGEVEKQEEFMIKETELIKKAINQLNDYFNGKRKDFELPLYEGIGTEFQKMCGKY